MENCAVDIYFAKRMAPEGSESLQRFLANLLKAAREGHLCFPLETGMKLPSYLLKEALVEKEGHVYLRRNWECEQKFLNHLVRLKNEMPDLVVPIEFRLNSSLEPEQKKAILNASKRSLSLICGGPGTGKTFTAATLIRSFLPYLEVVVAAPTGKAASNLRRSLEGLCMVQTLHSLLKKRYLTADLVVVDEASMIDAEMMASLFSAIKEGARLVLIGDKDQLPPVESGNFFSELAGEKELVTMLGRCLRAELQEIVEMAQAVKRGEEVPFSPLPELKYIVEAVLERGACVLTPLRHGPWGVQRLNRLLLKEHLLGGGKRFPIMIRVNDPILDLYNGDIGELIPEEKKACFGEREIPEYQLPHYEYAYVLSVHKSQGSEYDEVIILLPEGSEVFGRQMLYTAVTRAKKRVEIYASEGVLSQILSKREHRFSGFTHGAISDSIP